MTRLLWIITLSAALGLSATACAVNVEKLPLGDYEKSSAPKRGWVYSCQQADMQGGGAGKDGPWIDESAKTWDSTSKLAIQGSVDWNSVFSAKTSGTAFTVAGNGLPSAPTGTFPVAASDPAYQYDRNPNSISANAFSYSLPAHPKLASSPTCVGGEIGVSTLGVPFFSAFDATLRDAAAHEVQDSCSGHPQNRGVYHYHSLPHCFKDKGGKGEHSSLAGYALDGFGIYGYRGKNGKQLDDSDLDACHGHVGWVKFHGRMQRVYHYHATREFPYLVGCFRGTPIKTRP